MRGGALAADVILLLVPLAWGATFTIVKQAVAEIPPLSFLAIRFFLAALFLLPFFWRPVTRAPRAAWAAAGLIGLFLFGGYAFQTTGLQWTTASKAAFIQGLSVVFVPLLSTAVLRRPPGAWPVAGVAVATAGLALLTWEGRLSLGKGEALVLAGAMSFALHIIAVSRYSGRFDPGMLSTVQIGVVSLASAVGALAREPTAAWARGYLVIPPLAWTAILVTGVFCTSAAFLIQNQVQRYTSPTHTALIFATEPVFAAVFSYWLAGERLAATGVAGAALVMAGMLVSEMGQVRPAAGRPSWARNPCRR